MGVALNLLSILNFSSKYQLRELKYKLSGLHSSKLYKYLYCLKSYCDTMQHIQIPYTDTCKTYFFLIFKTYTDTMILCKIYNTKLWARVLLNHIHIIVKT